MTPNRPRCKIASVDSARILRLASAMPIGDPDRRVLLAFLQKNALEFPTEDALKKYLKDHPDADPKNHSVQKSKQDGAKGDDDEGKGLLHKLKTKVVGLLKDIRATSEISKALTDTTPEVQQAFLDTDTYNTTFGKVCARIEHRAKKFVSAITNSISKEVHEIKHAVHASKKLLKRPPGPFSKEDKGAFYSAGAYVAGTMLAAIPPGGALMAAGALGKSFAMHVGVKAVSLILDKGFTHFEWAETLLHGIHHIAAKDDGDKKSRNEEDRLREALVRALVETIPEVLRNLTDEDRKMILRGELPRDKDEG